MSELYKKIDAGVREQFPGKIYGVADHDDDENTFLIVVQSDRLYGTYYEYNVNSGEFKLLYDLMPQLKEEDMAEMRPITFQSRDGLTLHGYITLPKEALEGKKVPLIVNPHGDPGASDSWVSTLRRSCSPTVDMLPAGQLPHLGDIAHSSGRLQAGRER